MEIDILKCHNLLIPVKSQLDLKYVPLSALFQLQYSMKTLQYKSTRSVNICALSTVWYNNKITCSDVKNLIYKGEKNQDNLEGVHSISPSGENPW